MAARLRSSAAGKGFIIAVLFALAAVWASPAAADPPDWAPAYGYRAKHKYKNKQRHERQYRPNASYVAPIDIRLGRCNRDRVGGRTIGVFVGGAVGALMAAADQGCVGHTLETVPDGQPITWNDPDHGRTYRVTPESSYRATNGQICRDYVTEAVIGGRSQEVVGTACRQPDGAWKLSG